MTNPVYQLAAFLLAFIASIATASASQFMEVQKTDGSRHQGDLASWNTQGVTVLVDGQTLSAASSDILRLNFAAKRPANSERQTFLLLVDGTRLPYHSFTVLERSATIKTLLFQSPLSLPARLIHQVEFMPQTANQFKDDLAGDQLIVFKQKTKTYDSLDGILGDVTADQVAFTWDGDVIPVKRSKVAAIAYFHAKKPDLAKPLCWLALDNGAKLPISNFEFEADTISVTTTTDINLSIPLSSLRSADFSAGKLTYLSDLNPQSQQWTPRINLPKSAELIQQFGLPRRDQSFTGSAISLLWPHPKTGSVGGPVQTYDKGLALRSRTTCRYRIPKGMTRFSTIAGIDPQTSEQGHVTLELLADERSVWRGEIAGGRAPKEINVSLEGARTLQIVVDFGENLDFGDRLHLAEARVSK